MKVSIIVLIMLHAIIHLAGFAKAFGLAPVNQLSQNISKNNGVLWVVASLLFTISALLIYLKQEYWWMIALAGTLISQYLVVTSWNDAKYGSIVNIVILLAIVIGYGSWHFERKFRKEIVTARSGTVIDKIDLLTERDIQDLPDPIKKYLYYTEVIGKPKVQSFSVFFKGEFRQDINAAWMPFDSEQANFIANPTRLFFMKSVMKRLPVSGFHCYKPTQTFMDIRLLSLFKVQYQSGTEMDIAETVTFFNDMCVMAPSTLIDKRIKWLQTEGNVVSAEFTNRNIIISATLHFNEKGELVNFISDNRYALHNNSMMKARWSTPLRDYKMYDGYRLASYGETIYNYPEGAFCYGKFRLTKVEYNGGDVKKLFPLD